MSAEQSKGPGKKTLASVVGVAAASILFVTIPKDEGTEYRAYKDIVGIWTICNGDTANVRPGMVETKEGCQARLERQLIAHAEPVMKCVPTLWDDGRENQRAALVSLAYNVGIGAACKSTRQSGSGRANGARAVMRCYCGRKPGAARLGDCGCAGSGSGKSASGGCGDTAADRHLCRVPPVQDRPRHRGPHRPYLGRPRDGQDGSELANRIV